MDFDLLTTVEHGGCSAKVSPEKLAEALRGLAAPADPNVLVGLDSYDDAGVYRLSEDLALIQTVDFFPPICSNAFEFGEIAAANALSDVYAMGGTPLTAMNLVMFPSSQIPLEVLREILEGGLGKVTEAGAVLIGGHTIEDFPPKYGLAVTGAVHPERIVSNDRAQAGDIVILTKPLGTGIIVAGKRTEMAGEADYRAALNSMKQLHKNAVPLMWNYKVRCGTDVTGFGLLGHALKIAAMSGISIIINSSELPLLNGAYELAEQGCIPGAAFRNLEDAESRCDFICGGDYSLKMLMADAQTSGGLLLCAPPASAGNLLSDLQKAGFSRAAVIGEVVKKQRKDLILR